MEDWSKYAAQADDSAKDKLPPVEFFDSKQLGEQDDFHKFLESQNDQGKDKPPALKDRYDQSNVKDAVDAALKNGVPMVVHVGADWCGPCKTMEKTVWPGVEKDFKGKAAFTHLDIDKVKDPAEKVAKEGKTLTDGIQSVPTIKVVMPEKQKDGSIKFKTLEEHNRQMSTDEVRKMVQKWTTRREQTKP